MKIKYNTIGLEMIISFFVWKTIIRKINVVIYGGHFRGVFENHFSFQNKINKNLVICYIKKGYD